MRSFGTFEAPLDRLLNRTLNHSLNQTLNHRQCVDIIERGEITESELSNINYLYAGYSGLGGNGTGKDLYERAKNQRLIKNK